jgi:hypothetical protein
MLKLAVVKNLLSTIKDNLKNGKLPLSRIHIKDGLLSITDGHRAYQIPVNEPDGLYNHESVEYQSKMPNAKAEGVDIAISDQTPDELDSYPRLDQLMPNTDGEDYTKIVFNARYMRDLCDLAIAASDNPFIQLNVHTKYDQAYDKKNGERYTLDTIRRASVAYFKADNDGSVGRAVLMPTQMREGALKYTGKTKTREAAEAEAIAA